MRKPKRATGLLSAILLLFSVCIATVSSARENQTTNSINIFNLKLSQIDNFGPNAPEPGSGTGQPNYFAVEFQFENLTGTPLKKIVWSLSGTGPFGYTNETRIIGEDDESRIVEFPSNKLKGEIKAKPNSTIGVKSKHKNSTKDIQSKPGETIKAEPLQLFGGSEKKESIRTIANRIINSSGKIVIESVRQPTKNLGKLFVPLIFVVLILSFYLVKYVKRKKKKSGDGIG